MASDADFRWILAFTLRWEGGDHHPTLADPNPTRAGITQRFWNALGRRGYAWWHNASVYDLTPNDIANCYQIIWTQSKAVLMPRLVAAVHFDCSVNMSGPRANRVLQRAAGVVADGVVGPKTLEALTKKPEELARRAIGWRETEYRDIVEHNARLKPNLQGWINRCSDLRRYINVP